MLTVDGPEPIERISAELVQERGDEVAVEAFLGGRIGFSAIATTLADAVDRWGGPEAPALGAIAELDAVVRTELGATLGGEQEA